MHVQNTDTAYLLHLPEHARVWMYIAERKLSDAETELALSQAIQFCHTWTAHEQQLKADARFLFNQILILGVDEQITSVSGCSIDKSTHFVEHLGKELQIDFFSRDIVFYKAPHNEICSVKLAQMHTIEHITDQLSIFDVTVHTNGTLETFWKPVQHTWVKRFLK